MSESKHTPEPWEFGYGQTREFGMCLGIGLNSAPDWHVVAVVSPADSVNHADEANARRIVACVNACAGIETGHLEKYGLPDFAQKISDLREQRDELLAALERCRFALEPYDDIKPRDWKSDRLNLREAHQAAVAAIARAKGEQ